MKYQIYPLTDASQVWQRLDGDSIPAISQRINICASNNSFTPAQSIVLKRTVVLRAAKDEDHTLSHALHRPFKSKQNNIQSVTIEGELFVTSYTETFVAFD